MIFYEQASVQGRPSHLPTHSKTGRKAPPHNTRQLVTCRAARAPLLSSWPGSSYYNKVIANFVPQRWSFACWGDQPRIYASLYVCVCVYRVCVCGCGSAYAVPYILESIKRVFHPLDIALTAHRHSRFDEELLRWYSRSRGLNIKWRGGDTVKIVGVSVFSSVLVKLEYGVIGI